MNTQTNTKSIDTARRWEGRPVLSFAVRSAVFLLPILMSIGVSVGLSKAAPTPDNVVHLGLIWLVIIVASTATLMSVEKIARKALPLAAMLSLTMVFPDQSPSRFKTALRSGSSVKNLRAILAQAESVEDNSPAKSAELVLQLVTALNTHDPRTRGHAERVRAYTEMLAEEMNIDAEDRAKLRWASLLHDIGKLKVSPAVLNKPGKLDDEEWEQIKMHPVFGEEICGPLLDWLGPWAGAVVDHHERFDGNGYPHGKAGSEISQAGRIVCVADAYDVMTTVRSYKEPMSTAEARQELARHAGAQFDPKVVRTFLNLSMGRLRWIAGPLSWLAQLPFLQGLAGVAQSVGSTVGVAAVATGGAAVALTAGVVSLPGSGPLELPEPPPALVQFVDTPLYVAPVARDDFATAPQGSPRVINILSNDELAGVGAIAIVTDPSFGTVIVNADGTVTYIPSGDYVGQDEFVYEVIDSAGGSTTATVVVTVVGVNEVPIVRGDSATVDEDGAVDIDVLANDDDLDGTITSIELVGQPANGVATLNSNLTVRYQPDPDYFGSDVITYVAIDDDGGRSQGTVSVTVRPVNDPVSDPGPGTLVAAGGKSVRFDPMALAVDKDGDPVSLAWFDAISTAGGTIVEGSLIYTPPYAYLGSDTFRYALTDGVAETVVTVRLDVRGTPDKAGPTITLLGANPLVMTMGEKFTDPGAKVADADPSFKPSFIVDATALDTSKAGSYPVVYSATDPSGNKSSQTRTVVVQDTSGPQLVVKGSNPLTMEAGQLYVEAGATATDAKDGDLSASVIVDTSLLNVGRPGTYTVSYRVTDSDGKEATAQRTVKVIDTTKPKIVLKGANPQTIESGGTYVELGATAADNDTSFAASAVPNVSGIDTTRPGTYTVTYSVSDSSGNTALAVSRTVKVVDTTKPVITLQGANPQGIETGTPYVELGATATDNDATFGASPTADKSGVNTAVPGTYTVVYSVSDASGNTKTKNRTVVVGDVTPPVVTPTGSNPQVVQAGNSYVELGATATDNDVTFAAVPTANSSGVNTSIPGSYTVIYSVSDPSGNTGTANRTVSVIDTTPPVVTRTGVNPQVIEAGSAYVELGATATDNDASFAATPTANSSSVNTSVPGSYTVVYSVTDASGNTGTVNRTVAVVDTTAPTITLTGANPQVIETGSAYVELGATATDNDASFAATPTANSSGVNTASPGSYTVIYSVTDASGNTGTANRTVTVADTTAPVIMLTGANPQVIEAGASYVELGATATDNDASFVGVPTADASGVDTSTPGSYVVVYSVTDPSGNTGTANRTVSVIDTTDPVITVTGANPQTIEAGGSYAELGASATDNDASFSATPAADTSAEDTSTPGSYVVVYSVTDGSGNTGTANRTVNVVDTTDPVITLTGANPQVIEAGVAYTELGATATDNDGAFAATPSANSSGVDTSTPGSYLVSYSVTDASGNTGSTSRTVSVIDTTDPVITLTGANPQVIEAGVAYTELGATATDNDSAFGATPSANASGVDTSTPGSYVVAYSVTDASGNTGTANRTVSVVDTTPPTVTASQNTTIAENTAIGTTVMTVAATDAVGVTGFTIVGGSSEFSIDSAGALETLTTLDYESVTSYTLPITATDAAGNTSVQEDVTVNISNINEQPVAVDDSGASTTTDVTIAIDSADWMVNDSDPDGETPIFDGVLSTTTSLGGSITDPDMDGIYAYTPPSAAADVTDSFVYRIKDAAGLTDTATVSVDVDGAIADLEILSIVPSSTAGLPLAAVTGQTVSLVVTVKNNGPDSGPGSKLVVPLDELEFTLDGASSPGCIHDTVLNEVRCSLANIGVGASKARTLVLVPLQTGPFTLTSTHVVDATDLVPANDTMDSFLSVALGGLVISEVSTEGAGDFVELYNSGGTTLDIAGYEVRFNGAGVSDVTVAGADTVLAPGEHFLLAEVGGTVAVSADQTFAFDLPPDVGIRLRDATGTIDEVGFGSASWYEGTRLPVMTPNGALFEQSYERLGTRTSGNCLDTGDNAADFILHWNNFDPENTSAPADPCGPALYVASSSAGDVVINEVLYSQLVNDEFIEIYNAGSVLIDLTGWTIADSSPHTGFSDAVNPLSYALPATDLAAAASTLAPGEYAVVWVSANGGPVGADLEYNAAAGLTGSLGANDELWLVDAAGAIVDYIAWGDPLAVGSERDTPLPQQLAMWDDSNETALAGAAAGTSISLTPSGTDSDDSNCWEATASGTSACGPTTVDSDLAVGRVTSVGAPNIVSGTDLAFTSSTPAANPTNPIEITTGVIAPIDLTFTNNGPTSATGVVITVPLSPLEFTFDAANSSVGCAYNAIAEEVTCTLANLNTGVSDTVTVAVVPVAAGAYVLAPTVSAAGNTDPTPANNSGSLNVTVTAPPTYVVISELSTDRTTDFVELYNPTALPIDISGYQLRLYPPDGTAGFSVVTTIPLATSLPGYAHYLIGNTANLSGYNVDRNVSFNVAKYGGVELFNGVATVIDGVGTQPRPGGGASELGAASREGAGLPPLNPGAVPTSFERQLASGLGNCIDTNDNASDFVYNSGTINPQGKLDAIEPCGAPPPPPAPSASSVVISELRGDGPNDGADEIIEIFNATASAVVMDGWKLELWDTSWTTAFTFTSLTLQPGQHFLLASSTATLGGVTPDGEFGPGAGVSSYGTAGAASLKNDGGARLLDDLSAVVDTVGMGTAPGEGTSVPKPDGRTLATYERLGGGAYGSCVDTANNSSDFILRLSQDLQNLASPFIVC